MEMLKPETKTEVFGKPIGIIPKKKQYSSKEVLLPAIPYQPKNLNSNGKTNVKT